MPGAGGEREEHRIVRIIRVLVHGGAERQNLGAGARTRCGGLAALAGVFRVRLAGEERHDVRCGLARAVAEFLGRIQYGILGAIADGTFAAHHVRDRADGHVGLRRDVFDAGHVTPLLNALIRIRSSLAVAWSGPVPVYVSCVWVGVVKTRKCEGTAATFVDESVSALIWKA